MAIIMKYLKLIMVAIFFVTSCQDDCEYLVDEVLNNSGRKVEITVYQNYEPNTPFGTFSKKHVIENNQAISQTTKNCAPYSSTLDFVKLMKGDSIVIDFGDKKLRYGIKNVSSPRNPFYLSRISIGAKNFTYTLTPEDYTNALP